MYHRYVSIAALVALAVAGCSRYGYVSLSYPVEPAVILPDSIHSIAIVNRSVTGEEAKDKKVMEAIMSTEIGSDFLASDACIKGVYDGMAGLPYTELVIPDQVRMEGTGTREMPELLDWDMVEELCTNEEADVLLVLENFDSNTDLLARAATEQISSIVTTGRPRPAPPSQAEMSVAAFWRMYDPGNRRIVDQFQYNGHMHINLSRGIPPPDALPMAAYDAGRAYVARFLPGSYRVKRKLYKRTSGSARRAFRAGFRRTEVANWTGAMEIWEELTGYPKRKTAGRACLNMAVANEVLGHTEPALEWAGKSYEFYHNKLGRDYAKILLRRKRIEGLTP